MDIIEALENAGFLNIKITRTATRIAKVTFGESVEMSMFFTVGQPRRVYMPDGCDVRRYLELEKLRPIIGSIYGEVIDGNMPEYTVQQFVDIFTAKDILLDIEKYRPFKDEPRLAKPLAIISGGHVKTDISSIYNHHDEGVRLHFQKALESCTIIELAEYFYLDKNIFSYSDMEVVIPGDGESLKLEFNSFAGLCGGGIAAGCITDSSHNHVLHKLYNIAGAANRYKVMAAYTLAAIAVFMYASPKGILLLSDSDGENTVRRILTPELQQFIKTVPDMDQVNPRSSNIMRVYYIKRDDLPFISNPVLPSIFITKTKPLWD